MPNMNDIYASDDLLYGMTPHSIPRRDVNIGVDTDKSIYRELVDKGLSSKLDMGELESFLHTARNRDQIYALIDMMSEDSTMESVLETYVEDTTVPNEHGDIIWAVSDIPELQEFCTRVLDSFRVNKNMPDWVFKLYQYGDIYLRLYRKSDYEADDLFDTVGQENENDDPYFRNTIVSNSDGNSTSLREEALKSLDSKDRKKLQESVKVRIYDDSDPYEFYLEIMPNPAEMFELTKYGKSFAYIKADINSISGNMINSENWAQGPDYLRYKFKKSDVTIYQATEFVHGYIGNTSSRTPEQVQISIGDDMDPHKEVGSYTYTVRRGQSILYNTFRIWRELELLEDSVLLNRVTRSSIVRAIGVEVKDMPREDVQGVLQGIKGLMEQKAGIDVGNSMVSYTNPGPVENNIYIATRDGQGALNVQQIGGDVNVGDLNDLDYFQDKLFGGLKVPKQYFSHTDDSTGFNGGTSLTIISARYAKTIMKGQNAIIQALTDAINTILYSMNKIDWVDEFTLKMTTPVTQHDLDMSSIQGEQLTQISNAMEMIKDAEQGSLYQKKALECMLTPVLNNPQLTDLMKKEIEKAEREEEAQPEETHEEVEEELSTSGLPQEEEKSEEQETYDEGVEEETLPTPEDLGIDFTDSSNFNRNNGEEE